MSPPRMRLNHSFHNRRKITVSVVLIGVCAVGYVFYAGSRVEEPDAILLDEN